MCDSPRIYLKWWPVYIFKFWPEVLFWDYIFCTGYLKKYFSYKNEWDHSICFCFLQDLLPCILLVNQVRFPNYFACCTTIFFSSRRYTGRIILNIVVQSYRFYNLLSILTHSNIRIVGSVKSSTNILNLLFWNQESNFYKLHFANRN